jgi:LacI family transcriptional regulator
MATIRDVAKLARVSPITVSRVINDIGPVNGQTRVRVLEAIDTLNYVPNQQARSLRSRRTHTLALLITDMTNPFWTTVARGVEDKAAENNFSVILCNTDEDATKEQRYVKVVLEKRVDGVIAAPTSSESTHFRQLGEQRIPLVLLDRRVRGLEIDIVLCENIGTSRDLVSSLIGQGHRRIAVISGPEQISTADERIEGYRQALQNAGLPIDPALIRRGPFTQATGQAHTHELLALSDPPTAIFACNNFIAYGTLITLNEHGVCMPEQMKLATFDEIPLLSLVAPSLTVAVQPAYEMGVVATELLIDQIRGAKREPREVVLQPTIIYPGQVQEQAGQL